MRLYFKQTTPKENPLMKSKLHLMFFFFGGVVILRRICVFFSRSFSLANLADTQPGIKTLNISKVYMDFSHFSLQLLQVIEVSQ